MNLFRTLKAREIECRVQQATEKGVILLLYKDARCDQSILDETVGPYNWQRTHGRDNANCVVSIWDETKQQWISKEDTGTESNTEAAKGLASDSFKRACVNWGIGRELYTAPFIWISSDKCKIEPNRNGKGMMCRDHFEVSAIDYDENREICALTIVNAKNREVVYQYGKNAPQREKTSSDEKPAKIICEDCGKPITPWIDSKGKVYSPLSIAERNIKSCGRKICVACAMKQKNAAE